jgi:hypothetical protein
MAAVPSRARTEILLHTNGSENDLRGHVIKRKISGGTQSEAGWVVSPAEGDRLAVLSNFSNETRRDAR